jgi:hypothetical protein
LGSHPIDDLVVCKAKDKLVNNTINADCPADEFHGCVFGVVEYEMIAVERCES